MNIKVKNIVVLFFFFLSIFLCSNVVNAEYIGLDERGIYCFDDSYNPVNNEWITLDLDFDGKYEKYYFDKTGLLLTDEKIAGNHVNFLGQNVINGNVETLNVSPNANNAMQIDNPDYYYISKTTSGFNGEFDIDGTLKARVTILLPIIEGKDIDIVKKVNAILRNRGLELLKLYAKEEAYKANTKKLNITIERYNRRDSHRLNFIKDKNDNFYFDFNVNIVLENKNEHKRNIGLMVDYKNYDCIITNSNYLSLNSKTYINEEEITKKPINEGDGYSERYKDVIITLKEGYIDELTEYLDNAEKAIEEYEKKYEPDKKKEISYIESYIKGISSIYYNHLFVVKKMRRDAEIDEETYILYEREAEELYIKYKGILNKNLKVDINSLKEMIINEK